MGLINNNFDNGEMEVKESKKTKKEDKMKSSKTKAQRAIESAWPVTVEQFAGICLRQKTTSVNIAYSVHRDIIEQIFWELSKDLPEGVQSFNLHFVNFRDGSKNTLFIGVEDAQTPGIIKICMCSNIWNSAWKEVTDFVEMLENPKASMQYIHQDDITIDPYAWWNN